MENKDHNPTQEFINRLTEETQAMLSNFSSDEAREAMQQYSNSWYQMAQQSMDDPGAWINSLAEYQQQQLSLWNQLLTGQASDVTRQFPRSETSRFTAEQWSESPVFDYIKQSYLLTSKLLNELSANTHLSEQEQKKLAFYTKQYTDAMSPSNFAVTNPEVMALAMESKGQSLVDGLQNLLKDMENGRISMTDESAFSLGDNLAVTDGEVVFENELFQLIHYKPSQEQVYSRPTLIIPPCINKFYILDLQPGNSFVKHCVDQGMNTFLISWVNPDKQLAGTRWDDYLDQGIFKAMEVTQAISGQETLNAVSWCVGGTLLASALAVMAKRDDKRIASATFLTTMLDFRDPGEISVFIDEPQVEQLLAKAKQDGILSGRQLSLAFNMLRSNDLIWSYVVNNYLKGKQPAPFDILYWNSDSTNLPAAMYSFYITEMYLKNNFCKPDEISLCGEKIDLSQIDIPCYFLSTIGDHIAPWKSTFDGMTLLGGNKEFVLGASGHIAGVINPPAKKRRHFWVNGEQQQGADHWLETAERKEGSWWGHWTTWLKRRAGKKQPAPEVGSQQYPAIEPAPGRYVRVKIEDIEKTTA